MWLNRLDDRPQSNRHTIAPDYFLSGDRSSRDDTFSLKVRVGRNKRSALRRMGVDGNCAVLE
jgi:hypothetical protein